MDARQVRSRKAMETALIDLLGRSAFDDITIVEIVREAGIGYRTFFRHFRDKDDLLEAVAADAIAELLRLTIPVMSTQGSFESCLALCEEVDRRRALWTVLLTGGAAANVRAEFVRQARKWAVEKGWRDASREDEMPVDLGTRFSAVATIEVLSWWLEQPEPFAAERIARIIDRAIIRPYMGYRPQD